jgi:hypothetical protein
MGENKFRIEPKKSSKGTGGGGVFSGLEKKLNLESYFEEGFPIRHLPKMLFVMVLGLFYIGNTHYAEKTVIKINAMQTEVEDLRADYTTLKADLMFASKQSEVAKRVRDYGLRESLTPPFKIVVDKK